MPFGFSVWTVICAAMVLIGLVVQDFRLVTWGVLLYLLGWVLRLVFGTRR